MQTLRASKCGLSTAQLPSSILDVIDSLTKAGYEAYIVGGGVRDMMLGLNPKDFDAVTNATPAQVKEVWSTLPNYWSTFRISTCLFWSRTD